MWIVSEIVSGNLLQGAYGDHNSAQILQHSEWELNK
jgi:hypothetical protein